MKLKLGIINNNNDKLTTINYENIREFIKLNIINKITIEDYEFENLNKLFYDFWVNDDFTKKTRKVNFEFLHCFENDKFCFYCVYPYGSNDSDLKINYNAGLISRNNEKVLSKMLILKYDITLNNYSDLLLEDLIDIYENHFIYNSIFINKNENIITNIELLTMNFNKKSENDNLMIQNPSYFLKNLIKIKNISHKHGIINIMYTDEKIEENFIEENKINELLTDDNKKNMNEKYKIIDSFISEYCPNYSRCIINYYYFCNGQLIIYKINIDFFIKLIKHLNILEINDDELYIYHTINNIKDDNIKDDKMIKKDLD